jgi:hypothetical protein
MENLDEVDSIVWAVQERLEPQLGRVVFSNTTRRSDDGVLWLKGTWEYDRVIAWFSLQSGKVQYVNQI